MLCLRYQEVEYESYRVVHSLLTVMDFVSNVWFENNEGWEVIQIQPVACGGVLGAVELANLKARGRCRAKPSAYLPDRGKIQGPTNRMYRRR